ncbi:MAG: hypothetical protein IKT45_04725 [Lachnospiraceae bacterium]|nr:hypothetical protein [Lachnospiraceae bacterium]
MIENIHKTCMGGMEMARFSFQSMTEISMDPVLLERDWKEAHPVDTIRLGQRCLYCPGMLKVRYVPYYQIQWAFLRAQETRMSMCCGRVLVDIWYLLLYADGKEIAKIEFQKKELAKEVLDYLEKNHKHILIGYSEVNKRQALG